MGHRTAKTEPQLFFTSEIQKVICNPVREEADHPFNSKNMADLDVSCTYLLPREFMQLVDG